MGSGASREDVIDSKWWETKAYQMLKTANTSKIGGICSLIPMEDKNAIHESLKGRSDLDTLFTLHRSQQPPESHTVSSSKLTDDLKAVEILRALVTPPEYGASCSWSWQPPLIGNPDEIAGEFHEAVSRALFRIPFLELVKWALGYDNTLITSFFNVVCDIRDNLRKEIRDHPETRDIYIEVEKKFHWQQPQLACWIVASSLSHASYPLQTALAFIQDPIKNLFATRNLRFVLKRLAILDRRFKHINQDYNWGAWSSKLEFWEWIYQALWTETLVLPTMPSNLLLGETGELLRFLRIFDMMPEDEIRDVGKMAMFLRRLRGGVLTSAQAMVANAPIDGHQKSDGYDL